MFYTSLLFLIINNNCNICKNCNYIQYNKCIKIYVHYMINILNYIINKTWNINGRLRCDLFNQKFNGFFLIMD